MANSMDRTGAIPALTGVRFFAALMVFCSHYALPGSTGFFMTAQQSGYAGVTFFFILSGFIIAYNYLVEFERSPTTSIIPFYFARFSRIYPLYFFCLMYAVLISTTNEPVLPHLLAVQAWYDDVLYAMGFNGTAWSISVEAFLYLMFPLIIPAMSFLGITSSRRKLLITIATIITSIFICAFYFWLSGKGALSARDPSSAHRWLYRTPLSRLLDFSLGICTAIYYMRFWRDNQKSVSAWSIIIYGSIIASVLLMGYSGNYYSSFSWDATYAIPFTLIIFGLAAVKNNRITDFLSRPTLILLGEASFAFYLTHLLMKKLYITDSGTGLIHTTSMYLVFLLMVTSLSVGLHLIVEKPAQKFLRSLFGAKKRTLKTIGQNMQ